MGTKWVRMAGAEREAWASKRAAGRVAACMHTTVRASAQGGPATGRGSLEHVLTITGTHAECGCGRGCAVGGPRYVFTRGVGEVGPD